MCIVYGQQVWIMPLFKAVPLQLVDRHSLPSVLCGGNCFHFRVYRETVWEEQCASVHTTCTRTLVQLNTTILYEYKKKVWVWKTSKNESARRHLPVGSNSCVGVPGSLSLLGLLSGGWSLLRMLLVLQTQTEEINVQGQWNTLTPCNKNITIHHL